MTQIDAEDATPPPQQPRWRLRSHIRVSPSPPESMQPPTVPSTPTTTGVTAPPTPPPPPPPPQGRSGPIRRPRGGGRGRGRGRGSGRGSGSARGAGRTQSRRAQGREARENSSPVNRSPFHPPRSSTGDQPIINVRSQHHFLRTLCMYIYNYIYIYILNLLTRNQHSGARTHFLGVF